jgi:hypothetical protein
MNRRDLIFQALSSGKSRNDVYNDFLPLVQAQVRPWIFTRNVPAQRRQPKPMSEQMSEFLHEINRAAAIFERRQRGEVPEVPEAPETEITEQDKPERPIASGKRSVRDSMQRLFDEIQRLRRFLHEREMSGEAVDSIGMRWAIAGRNLIPAGIPPEAIISAGTLHWPNEMRQSARIADFDFLALSQEIMRKREISEIVRADGSVEIPHQMFGYILTLIECNQPVFAFGTHGTGKSTVFKQIAEFLEMDYAEGPMNAGATRGDFLGRHTAKDFVAARFTDIYSNGGIYLLEEFDAADSRVLITLNNALSGNELYNVLTGETHKRHPDFRAAANGNTMGLGATRAYTGRERLDAATLDRWNCGRVKLNVDVSVERSILLGN